MQTSSTSFTTSFDASASANVDRRGQSVETIDIQQGDELARWVNTLGVSEEQLRMAVAAVGAQADDVRNHFGVVQTTG